MKFKLESEFALHIYEILKTHFINRRREIQIITEVPRFSHNNHMDMLLIDRKMQKLLGIEFKLKDYKSLVEQINRSQIRTVGILNTRTQEENKTIFSYLGEDDDITRILFYLDYDNSWSNLCEPLYSMERGINNSVYWWGYLDYDEKDINPGVKYANRESYYEVYRRAAKNFYKKYGGDFYLFYSSVGGCYSYGTGLKHYTAAIKELDI